MALSMITTYLKSHLGEIMVEFVWRLQPRYCLVIKIIFPKVNLFENLPSFKRWNKYGKIVTGFNLIPLNHAEWIFHVLQWLLVKRLSLFHCGSSSSFLGSFGLPWSCSHTLPYSKISMAKESLGFLSHLLTSFDHNRLRFPGFNAMCSQAYHMCLTSGSELWQLWKTTYLTLIPAIMVPLPYLGLYQVAFWPSKVSMCDLEVHE